MGRRGSPHSPRVRDAPLIAAISHTAMPHKGLYALQLLVAVAYSCTAKRPGALPSLAFSADRVKNLDRGIINLLRMHLSLM